MTTNRRAEAPRWSAFGASVRGVAHERAGLPNEDAVAWQASESGRWAFAATADGHGHALAVRADVGSKLAVDAARVQARQVEESEQPAAILAQSLGEAIANSWRAAVLTDLAASPLSADELEHSGNSETLVERPETAYGTTVLVTLALENHVLTCQVGDGELVVVDAGGAVSRPMPPDGRLIGTMTTSLSSPSVLDDLRFGGVEVGLSGVGAVVAATDGYVNSFSADDGFSAAARDLWKLLREIGPEAVRAELEGWLASTSADGTGDDASLVLLFDEALLERTRGVLP